MSSSQIAAALDAVAAKLTTANDPPSYRIAEAMRMVAKEFRARDPVIIPPGYHESEQFRWAWIGGKRSVVEWNQDKQAWAYNGIFLKPELFKSAGYKLGPWVFEPED